MSPMGRRCRSSSTGLRRWRSRTGCVIAAYFFQQLRVDISSADDGHVHLRVGQFIAVGEERGYRHGSAGLSHCIRICCQEPYSFASLVFLDGDVVLDIAPDVLEGDRAEALGAESISNGARDLMGREVDDFSGAQTG